MKEGVLNKVCSSWDRSLGATLTILFMCSIVLVHSFLMRKLQIFFVVIQIIWNLNCKQHISSVLRRVIGYNDFALLLAWSFLWQSTLCWWCVGLWVSFLKLFTKGCVILMELPKKFCAQYSIIYNNIWLRYEFTFYKLLVYM